MVGEEAFVLETAGREGNLPERDAAVEAVRNQLNAALDELRSRIIINT